HADDASMLLIYGVWDLLQEPAKNRPPKELVRQWLAWNNGTIRNLALSIRDGGQADLFPILADALEEGGCTNGDMLSACRRGAHDAEGAWVLRVLLVEE